MMRHSADPQAMLDDYRWLVGAEGSAWLERVAEMAAEAASQVALTANLRRELSQPRVQLLLEQIELRDRAREKFAHAGRMFFTRPALEQATDQCVAAYKASRFPQGQPLVDLCCGIGGDLLSLARRGSVCAVDRDPVMVMLAEANAAAIRDAAARDVVTQKSGDACAQSEIKFGVADVAEAAASLAGVAAWHIDPDRRAAGRRTTKVELHDPAPDILERLLTACPNAAIKLAPAADLPEPWWSEAELEWISRGRQCRQLVAWFGNLAQHPGRRRATIVKQTASEDVHSQSSAMEATVVTFGGEPNVECPSASQVGRYVFEPDAAVLAAKLEGALAVEQGLFALSPGTAYFTADSSCNREALACFKVLEVMPYRVKILRQWLAAHNIGRLEVKKRGVPLDPEQVRQELLAGRSGREEVTLLLARIQGKITAILGRRLI
jgi:SAM-dependent methyltransferase